MVLKFVAGGFVPASLLFGQVVPTAVEHEINRS